MASGAPLQLTYFRESPTKPLPPLPSESRDVKTPGVQTSVGTPATSMAGNGKRPGPRGVQWDPSSDRKYARLYSLSDANIDDIPLIIKGDKLRFK
jgi:hypothetical protein